VGRLKTRTAISHPEETEWIRCKRTADGNWGLEVASCGTSSRGNGLSSDLTDSDITKGARGRVWAPLYPFLTVGVE
jgi:hypothetical protein